MSKPLEQQAPRAPAGLIPVTPTNGSTVQQQQQSQQTPLNQTSSPTVTTSPTTATTIQEQAAAFDIGQYQRDQNIKLDQRYKTEDVLYDKAITFQSLGLSIGLLKGIAECAFTSPSPIQARAIPQVLMGNDVIARAKNGTGKTAAFCIPIVQRIDPSKNYVQAIILASTRELVTQIGDFLKKLTRHLNLKIVTSFGGNELKFDFLALQQGVHIVVATSGRIESIASKGYLNNVKMCAIDEVDKFYDANTSPFTTKLFTQLLPLDCQKILFSATFPKQMQPFLSQHVPEAAFVNVMDNIALRGVTQHYLVVTEDQKLRALRELIGLLKIDQCIIFCSTAQRAEALAQRITSKWRLPCFAISGSMPPADRASISKQFVQKSFKYLVATDLFARGFDLATVNVVINFDLTSSPETYLHRIGRCGRFGHLGLAVNLVNPSNGDIIKQYEDKLGTQITQLPRTIDHESYADSPTPTPSPVQLQPAVPGNNIGTTPNNTTQ